MQSELRVNQPKSLIREVSKASNEEPLQTETIDLPMISNQAKMASREKLQKYD